MIYAAQHASALAALQRKGAAVTFKQTLPGTLNAQTEEWSGPSTAEVDGYAIEVRGDPREYEALELVRLAPATLLFAALSFGDAVALGAAVTWAGIQRTVRQVTGVQPDGTAIMSRVVVA